MGDDPLDLLVLGSGVAGLTAAVQATERYGMSVGVLTKGALQQSTTRWAQGGVAAVLGEDPDSTDLHLADTLAAGAGLCDAEAARVLVDEGPDRVHALVALGASFDRDAEGRLELAREGGHSRARIVHAGGAATGIEIERALADAVLATAVAVHEHAFAVDLVVTDGRCRGVLAVDRHGRWRQVTARHVLLATGGAGQLFAVTTNPVEATGDGIAMALRAGAACADVEFVQFHPTALHHPRMPRPLLSEALRGHGALLRDRDGDRFVDELLPRDAVSRAMTARMADQGVDHLWLDATGLERFGERFPTIAAALGDVGLDPAADWLPIAPAAHYLCGGVVTDLRGATSVDGLWAAGEVACSGVHGANRLASNSLLEGMVFAHRVIEAIDSGADGCEPTGAMRTVVATGPRGGAEPGGPAASGEPGTIGGRRVAGWHPVRPPIGVDSIDGSPSRERVGRSSEGASEPPLDDGAVAALRDRLQRAMTLHAGVLRSATSLADASGDITEVVRALGAVGPAGTGAAAAGIGVTDAGGVGPAVEDAAGAVPSPAALEVANLAELATATLAAAAMRTESRGAHTRRDHPDTADAFRLRLVIGPDDR
ncbi:MAG: FAD-binding protein [Acidimicrobiia bacterium]|nr:FAD-binding protein [Acidimicrobiia bacterium]MCC5954366.1 FAD-binding protein [Acidimicrobiia bacterium]